MTRGLDRRSRQRGSAMLIVFLFAAILAITLYTEMPIVIFEAQRNKEQLLIDRGNEYSQAVKVYYRKLHQYPGNLDALENTNRVRYLRKKFKDPFTDKTDWRLLHAGPNGMLIDSKLKVAQTVTGAGNSALGTFNTGGNNQSPFGQTPFGATSPGNTGFGSQPSQFPAAGSSNRSNSQEFGGFQGGIASSAAGGVDPNSTSTRSARDAAPSMVDPVTGQALNPDGTPVVNSRTSQARTQTPVGTNGSAVGVIDASQAPPAQTNPNAAANPNAAVSGLISNPNGPTPPGVGPQAQNGAFSSSNGPSAAFGNSSFGSSTGAFGSNSSNSSNSPFGSSNNGTIQSGGLAGVASKLERHSIKAVNEQSDYSLWEFYYDPSKDPSRNALGAAMSQTGGGGGAVANAPGNSPFGSSPGNSPFGSSPGNSPFGGTQSNNSNSFGNSSFGSNNSNSSFGGFNSSNPPGRTGASPFSNSSPATSPQQPQPQSPTPPQ